jgi:DNA-binding GntR family transcriptional regulator
MASKKPRKSAAEAGAGSRMSDVAYSRILEALFDQRLPVGAFVSQSELVELIGIPLGPVREAVRILEAEGILVIHPRTGIQMLEPGLELTRATYQYRIIFESAAVAAFAETAPDDLIEHLKVRHEAVIRRLESHGLTETVLAELEALDELLHGSIIGSLRNPLIDTSYRRMRNYVRLLGIDKRLTPLIATRSMSEHLAIIEACGRRNVDDAVDALKAHFSAALQRSLGLY